MCGLRTHPRTDVDPPRVELLSVGVYRVGVPGRVAVTQFRSVSMPTGFRRHLVGKTLKKMLVFVIALKYALLTFS